jgi:hypothetical protein
MLCSAEVGVPGGRFMYGACKILLMARPMLVVEGSNHKRDWIEGID